jgi:dTMP kinase
MILNNFIVFEGIDGTGTTTQLEKLKSRYAENGMEPGNKVHFTCEPTSGEIGLLIRRALRGELHFTPDTMARLFASDRGEHIFGNGGIKKLIDSGNAVFSDRYFFSSLAYQGEAGDPGLALALNKDFPLPEYLFYFDIDPYVAMERVEKRAGTLEIYEKHDFQVKVRNRYLEIISDFEKKESGMRVIKIDASQPVGTIAENIWSIARNLPKL